MVVTADCSDRQEFSADLATGLLSEDRRSPQGHPEFGVVAAVAAEPVGGACIVAAATCSRADGRVRGRACLPCARRRRRALRSPGAFVSNSDLATIQSAPSVFPAIYQKDRSTLQAMLLPQLGLSGRPASTITDAGWALAFATIVAYDLKPYRDADAISAWTPPPRLTDLNSLLSAPAMVCNEYVALALRLFYEAYPKTPANFQINPVGWRRDSPFGNHAQIAVSVGAGVPLVFDPTLGLITRVSLGQLLSGQSAGGNYHIEPARSLPNGSLGDDQSEIEGFRSHVVATEVSGTTHLSPKFLIYSFLSRFSPGQSDYQVAADPGDFVKTIASGPSGTFYYLTPCFEDTCSTAPAGGSVGGELWQISSLGTNVANTNVWTAIAARAGWVQALRPSAQGGQLRQLSPSQNLLNSRGVVALAQGPDGNSAYFLTKSGVEYELSPAGSALIRHGIQALADGDGFYELTTAGRLFVKNAMVDWQFVTSNVRSIYEAQGSQRGEAIYVLYRNGQLWRIGRLSGDVGHAPQASPHWTLIARGVSDVAIGLGGFTLTLLQSNGCAVGGTVEQDDLKIDARGDVEALAGSPSQTALRATFTLPCSKRGVGFTSLTLSSYDSDAVATRADGSQQDSPASSY